MSPCDQLFDGERAGAIAVPSGDGLVAGVISDCDLDGAVVDEVPPWNWKAANRGGSNSAGHSRGLGSNMARSIARIALGMPDTCE